MNDICLEYKAKDESLYEDVKYMLHSMITISISLLMLDKNVILLPSLGDGGVYMDEGYLSILAKYSKHYDSLVDELISPYIDKVINKYQNSIK